MRNDKPEIAGRMCGLDWHRIERELDLQGWSTTGPLLTADECRALTRLYEDEGRFRSHVLMARHGFGRGEYRYFAYPLPTIVQRLREMLYDKLVETARRWASTLGQAADYPDRHEHYIARCRAAQQCRPTPLMLRYGPGDYNCLHQDLYGSVSFPLQAAFLLSGPGRDFDGGEFLLTEQRPRMQSRAQVVPLGFGEAVIFSVNQRPVQGGRGVYRVAMRHGVSTVREGARLTLGVILHDAS